MFNQATVCGYLGNDPETRYSQGGDAITTISVATSEKWKDKQGEQQERTEWHRITFFGRLAEVAGEYLKKGALVLVQGRLQTDKWTDKEGVERYTTKIIAGEMKMLGGKRDGDRQEGDQEGERERQQRSEHRQQSQDRVRQGAGGSAPQQQRQDDPFPDDDDDQILF